MYFLVLCDPAWQPVFTLRDINTVGHAIEQYKKIPQGIWHSQGLYKRMEWLYYECAVVIKTKYDFQTIDVKKGMVVSVIHCMWNELLF